MTEVLITQEVADKATEAAVDALMSVFIPALLRAGVTQEQITAAFNDPEAAKEAQDHDNA